MPALNCRGWRSPALPAPLDLPQRTDAAGATSYVLKAHNAGDSDPAEEYAEAQSALLAALQDSAVPVPAPLPLRAPAELSTDGYVLRVPGADGRVHAVRLLSWLPGTLLVDAPQAGGGPFGPGRAGRV